MNLDYIAIGDVAAQNNSIIRTTQDNCVLQFDADFACYEVADLEVSCAANFPALIDYLHMKRSIAGAGHINCFITLGMKSGRDTMATVKPYQENRDPDAPIKVRVRELRNALAEYKENNLTAVPCYFLEADDVMCRYQEDMIKEGRVKDSVLMSGDKDLWMVQGYHADPRTGRRWLVEGFGNTEYREVGNVKPKLVGEGTSWFWHQMIMGDKADNIPGLEKIDHETLDRYLPLKTKKPRRQGGSASCGEAKAVAMLDGVTTEKEAARRVHEAYAEFYGIHTTVRIIEQAYLLWMQRDDNPWDCLVYLKACGINIAPTKQQIRIVEEYIALRGDKL